MTIFLEELIKALTKEQMDDVLQINRYEELKERLIQRKLERQKVLNCLFEERQKELQECS